METMGMIKGLYRQIATEVAGPLLDQQHVEF